MVANVSNKWDKTKIIIISYLFTPFFLGFDVVFSLPFFIRLLLSTCDQCKRFQQFYICKWMKMLKWMPEQKNAHRKKKIQTLAHPPKGQRGEQTTKNNTQCHDITSRSTWNHDIQRHFIQSATFTIYINENFKRFQFFDFGFWWESSL